MLEILVNLLDDLDGYGLVITDLDAVRERLEQVLQND